MPANMFHRMQRFMPTAVRNLLHSRITRVGEQLRASDWRGVVGIIIGFGIILRLIPYLHNRSLWLDEVWLALNIIQKPYSQLVGVLENSQIAPIGFLFIEKFMVLTFGDSEYALRVFPLPGWNTFIVSFLWSGSANINISRPHHCPWAFRSFQFPHPLLLRSQTVLVRCHYRLRYLLAGISLS